MNPVYLLAIICYGVIAVAPSCATKNKVSKSSILPATVRLNSEPYIPIILTAKPNADTTKMPKPPTEKQVREMLNQSYKLSFDQLLAPEFQKLNNVILSQGKALQSSENTNQQLTEILQNMRLRSIMRNDSMNKVLFHERQQREIREKYFDDQQQKQILLNKVQISNLKNLVNSLMVVGIFMILSIAGLFIFAKILWKKVDNLSKQLSNA